MVAWDATISHMAVSQHIGMQSTSRALCAFCAHSCIHDGENWSCYDTLTPIVTMKLREGTHQIVQLLNRRDELVFRSVVHFGHCRFNLLRSLQCAVIPHPKLSSCDTTTRADGWQ